MILMCPFPLSTFRDLPERVCSHRTPGARTRLCRPPPPPCGPEEGRAAGTGSPQSPSQSWRPPRPPRPAAPLPQHRRGRPCPLHLLPGAPRPHGQRERREGKQAPEPCRKMREAVCLPAGDTTLRCSAACAAMLSALLLRAGPAGSGPAVDLSPPPAPLLRHPRLSWRRARKFVTLGTALG